MPQAAIKQKRNSGFFSILQRVGRAFMLPIALLPIAGLLLGIGSSFTNTATLEAYNLIGLMGPGTVIYSIFSVLASVGSVIFDNLPIIFAMGVALGMAENEKATATLSAAIAFFVMHRTINALLTISGMLESGSLQEGAIANVVGIQSLQMGVFGGIIVGLGVAALSSFLGGYLTLRMHRRAALVCGLSFAILLTLVSLPLGVLLSSRGVAYPLWLSCALRTSVFALSVAGAFCALRRTERLPKKKRHRHA